MEGETVSEDRPVVESETGSKDRQVVAALGAGLESEVLVVAGGQASQEAAGLLCQAEWGRPRAGRAPVTGPRVGRPPVAWPRAPVTVGLPSPQADLSHHALEQLAHVVVQTRRRLDELTIEHDRTSTTFWETREIRQGLEAPAARQELQEPL